MSSTQPWVSGPLEVLTHALGLMEVDNDRNRRIAMILIDNSVELTIKTYLGLPKRITGLSITKKEFDAAERSFPLLIEALEDFASEKVQELNLGEIEWYHRLRNSLYHDGNGITVEREKVKKYAEIAKTLLNNLFGEHVVESKDEKKLSEFLELWNILEKNIYKIYEKRFWSINEQGEIKHGLAGGQIIHEMFLSACDVYNDQDIERFKFVENLRIRVIRGEEPVDEISSLGIPYIRYLLSALEIELRKGNI